MWRVEQKHNVIRIFYYTRVWQQEGTVESTSGEPSYGPGWLSRPEARLSNACGSMHARELALACIMIRIHLKTGPRRVTEANADTREQGRELALAYMWRIHVGTGPRTVAEAIAGTVQIRCGRGMTPAC